MHTYPYEGVATCPRVPSMNTVFTDAICRILCLRRRRTYHWPAIAITHCASVFRIVAGTLSAFHARTTTSLRFSLLTRNTAVLLSSFVFFFSSFFFFTRILIVTNTLPVSAQFRFRVGIPLDERFLWNFFRGQVNSFFLEPHFLENLFCSSRDAARLR